MNFVLINLNRAAPTVGALGDAVCPEKP